MDYVEYRMDRGIVAIIDVTDNLKNEQHIVNSKEIIWGRTKIQREILSTMSEALKVPAYFVLHTKDMSLFHVYNLSDSSKGPRRMTLTEYTQFIKDL